MLVFWLTNQQKTENLCVQLKWMSQNILSNNLISKTTCQIKLKELSLNISRKHDNINQLESNLWAANINLKFSFEFHLVFRFNNPFFSVKFIRLPSLKLRSNSLQTNFRYCSENGHNRMIGSSIWITSGLISFTTSDQ